MNDLFRDHFRPYRQVIEYEYARNSRMTQQILKMPEIKRDIDALRQVVAEAEKQQNSQNR